MLQVFLGVLCFSLGYSISFGSGNPEVSVNFCCGEGEVMVVRTINLERRVAECLGTAEKVPELEGKEVWTVGEPGVMKNLKLMEVKKPMCERGLAVSSVMVNSTESQANLTAPIRHPDIELRGGNDKSGNVFIRGRPVCDDGWDNTDAGVACRMLGFSGGRATRESRYGSIPGGRYGMDNVECRGFEDSLRDCPHSSQDDCGPGEAAGVVCGGGGPQGAFMSLTAEGGLIYDAESSSEHNRSMEAVDPGQFCLIEGYTAKRQHDVRHEEGLVALSCDTCKEQVTCTYARELFDSLSLEHGVIRGGGYHGQFIPIVEVGDQNGDNAVDFEEFFSKLKDYVRMVFEVLDEDKDGSLFAEASTGNIGQKFTLHFFEEALSEVFDFFDSNNDNIIDSDDHFFASSRRWNDRNEDGEVTLSEFLGTSIISLPAPIYNFYSKLDRNTDEKLAKEEALDFIRRLFTMIDSDSDCHITTDEVVALLKDVEVTWDNQLAARMLLQQYLTLTSSIVNTFIHRADANGDSKVTIEEVLAFNDFDFIEDVVPTVLNLGYPQGSVLHLNYGRRRRTREEDEELTAIWLRALQNLMGKPNFTGGAAETSCSKAS